MRKPLMQCVQIFVAAALSTVLIGCGGLGYTPPPGAKLGDGFLALTISTADKGRMPQGADVVISIENVKSADPKQAVIIGDVIKLSMSDNAVKVNFPIDRHKLAECGNSTTCHIKVKIMKSGSARYVSNEPTTYKAGQSNAAISVTKAG